MILRRSDPDMFVASSYVRLFRFTALGSIGTTGESKWLNSVVKMVDITIVNGCFYGVYKPTVT